MSPKSLKLSIAVIETKIRFIRGHKVLLDRDLAELYQVEIRTLIQAVKRNRARFPKDFMFQLDWEETHSSRSQIVILKRGKNLKYRPYAFTEQGVAMLSSVLRSSKAIKVNIAIMRAFIRLRQIISSNKELAFKIGELDQRVGKHDHEIQNIIRAIQQLIIQEEKPKRRMGFHTD
jgi:hypothetical protein